MQQIIDVSEAIFTVIGALGSLATLLSHLPFVSGSKQAWFARFGMATQKFAVYNTKPGGVSEASR